MATNELTQNASIERGWSAFFEHFERFDQQRLHQKKEGLNDYSLLASVLRISDEVRLHSRFLFSMLNPAGLHFRGSAFAEAFMSALGHPDLLDWSAVRVHREHNYVDLYLTDGKRHVLIENKLNAIDQPGQIRRYVDWVRKEGEEGESSADADDVFFVYLSNGRSHPSPASLAPYQIETSLDGSYIVDSERGKLARFMSAHYAEHVLSWILTCLESVRDIKNLRNAFEEYRVIVQRVTKTYKSRVMNLESFLLEDSAEMDSRSRIRYAFEISKKLPLIKAGWLTKMFEEGLTNLLREYVTNGQLVPISATESVDLERFQFVDRHARLFFNEKGTKEVKDKGRFWRITSGPLSDSMVLTVAFGRSHLHIGLLPIRVSDSNQTEFDKTERKSACAFKLAADGEAFEFKRHAAINKVLPGLVSWSAPLDEEIENLATFEGSRQASVVKSLLERAIQGHPSLVSEFG
ncbi:PD-(D/E)XK nuclease family protein [Paraburkholderia sp. DGU8]|uniref:PDDEXK-like family protein n=1 Tax=Paraburkholderia sp. DGU8 TaxID=3161997 RepID=UPI0034678DEE